MSLSYVPLNPVIVRDNRTILDTRKDYAIVKSGKEQKFKQWTSNNVSSGSIQWTVPPPSTSFIVDRRIKMQLPVRLVLTGTVQPGQYLLNSNYDAPRQFPIMSAINTIQLSINNYSVSQNFAEYIHALLCYNTDEDLFTRDYSMSAACPDRSQNYLDLINTVANPLSMAGDSPSIDNVRGRGGSACYHVSLNPQNNTNQPQQLTGYVDLLATEYLFLSPLYWGAFQQIGAGFINVNTMDFTINFLTLGPNRMWSHAADPNISTLIDNSAQMYFKDFPTADPNNNQNPPIPFYYGNVQPLLFIHYITPSDALLIDNHTPVTYPYHTITKYVTDVPAIPFGSTALLQSNNIQLSNIPKKIYIYCRPTNNNFYANPSMTDSFYKISGLTIQFNNRLVMSEASIQDLYEISVKNGLNLEYADFAGLPFYKVGGVGFDNNDLYYGRGSILCIQPDDFGLYDNEAPGLGGQYNFQISNMSVTNINNSGDWDTFGVSIYVLMISEGSFTIPESGQASANLSVITQMDVLNAMENRSSHISYNQAALVQGGNFFSNLKKDLVKVNKFLQEHKPISRVSGLVADVAKSPLGDLIPYAPVVGDIARGVSKVSSALGYGGSVQDPSAENILGGRRINKRDLYDRIRRQY